MVEAHTQIAADNTLKAEEHDSSKVVIFILGTTGVGKSKLALDLAQHQSLFKSQFNSSAHGEIINADSMQVYSGNMQGAMTARPSIEDIATVPHHCYACVDMLGDEAAKNFNVQKYREMALKAINEVHARGNVPIVCGGTNYYIESLLFHEDAATATKNGEDAITAGHQDVAFDSETFFIEFDKFTTVEQASLAQNPAYTDLLSAFRTNVPLDRKQEIEDHFESDLCHQLLTEVDPRMAVYLHTNDKRKVVNALFKRFKHLAINKQIEQQSGENNPSGPLFQSDINSGQTGLALRFKPILIWIRADKAVLETRIKKRVDKMIDAEKGLDEIFHVFDAFTQGASEPLKDIQLDFSKGILQSIGYKEFFDYYLA